MCGIAGYINFHDVNNSLLLADLYHRGPDDQGIYEYKNLNLFHSRLAIQDIENGKQPLVIGDYVIVFNGEIYNHRELRGLLPEFKFLTNSDTETFLSLFIKFKYKAFDLIDGMFAFAILDKSSNKIILGRDRIGKKPLYYFKNKSKFFFASELNVILNHVKGLSINESSINSYLRLGLIPFEVSPYLDVLEVKPGYLLKVDLSTLQTSERNFFSLFDLYGQSKEMNKGNIYELDHILEKSIKRRISASDIEVGCFLSGGIDSSLIVAKSSQMVDKLKTFTVSFNNEFDESSIAAITSKKFSTDHIELPIRFNLKNDIEKILIAYGEPFIDSSAIPSYYISKAAKEHVSVILNGDGADELFGGYRRHIQSHYNLDKLFSKFCIPPRFLPRPKTKMSIYTYFYRLNSISGKGGLEKYASQTYDVFQDAYSFKEDSLSKRVEDLLEELDNSKLDSLEKTLYLDTSFGLQNDMLKKIDISTMQNSLEARSPFLGVDVLNYAISLPSKYKISGLKTKSILRNLAKINNLDYLSEFPKRGFEVPLEDWVENDLRELINDNLSSDTISEKYVDRGFIDKIINKNEKVHSLKRAKILWSLNALEVWHNHYKSITKIDKKNKLPILDSRSKKNILFLTTGLGLGGAERVILDIVSNINKKEFSPKVIGISSQNDLNNDFLKIGIKPEILYKKKNIIDFFRTVSFVFKYIKQNQIKVIHVHMFHALIISLFIKILLPYIKIIFTPHNTFISMPFRRIFIKCSKYLRSIDTVFTNSLKTSIYKKNTQIIPNGIQLDENVSSRQVSSKFKFLMVGRLEYMKNHVLAIKTMAKLKNFNCTLDIIGSGILEEDLKKIVKEYDVGDRVNFLGPTRKVNKFIEKSNCLLITSLWEAFPIVLLEAANKLLPIISTPVGSIEEILDDENAYLIKNNNLAELMIEVMMNQNKAYKKAEILKDKIVSNFNIQKIVRRYESIYRSL